MIEAILSNLVTYWPVHTLLLLYTLMLAWHAWAGNQETHGLADYYVGGRTMGGIALGLSFFATYSSTNSFVGFSGQSYTWGLAWLLLAPMAVALSAVAWTFVAPRLRRFTHALDSLTIPDFIGFRFGSDRARMAAAVIVIFASFFYMTAVFKGIGNLLEAFLEIPYEASIVIVFFIVMAYTMAGGFISVVKTDSVQGVVMIIAAVLLFSGTVQAAGGVTSLPRLGLREETRQLLEWDAAFPLVYVLGVVMAGTLKFLAEPRQLSRFYALEDDRAARTGVWVSTASFALVYTLLVPIGMYARLVLGDDIGADTDQVVPQLLTTPDVFSPGASAFLLLAMVAAAMSSLDSVLLVMASTAERDLASVLRGAREETAELRATRGYVALFALVTAVIALRPPGGIVSLTVLSGSLYAACFLPTVLLGLFWRRGNGTAVLGSFGAGILVLLVWSRLQISGTVHEIFPAVVLSLVAYVGLALMLPHSDDERVRALFDGS